MAFDEYLFWFLWRFTARNIFCYIESYLDAPIPERYAQTWILISVWWWFNQRQSHDNASRVFHKFASLLATSYSSKKWLQKTVIAVQIDFSLKQIDICFGWHLIISWCPNLDLFIRRQLPGPYYATRYLAVYWLLIPDSSFHGTFLFVEHAAELIFLCLSFCRGGIEYSLSIV